MHTRIKESNNLTVAEGEQTLNIKMAGMVLNRKTIEWRLTWKRLLPCSSAMNLTEFDVMMEEMGVEMIATMPLGTTDEVDILRVTEDWGDPETTVAFTATTFRTDPVVVAFDEISSNAFLCGSCRYPQKAYRMRLQDTAVTFLI